MFCRHCARTVEKVVGVIPKVSSIVADLDHHNMAVVVLTGGKVNSDIIMI